jgi:rare lipoprotein A
VLVLAGPGLCACASPQPYQPYRASLASIFPSGAPDNAGPVPKVAGNYKVGQPYLLGGRVYVPAHDPSYRSEGMASWYGPDFHGKPTANGEIFDMNGLSAAHPTLPMPSYLRVTNLGNGRSVIVRLNDRGPYARERVLDLSVGAAKALDFYGQGLARVRVEYVGRAPLGGSDDRMLLATLRQGSPAPVPSQARVASARTFAPPPERSFARSSPRSVVVRAPIAPADPLAPGLVSGRGLY